MSSNFADIQISKNLSPPPEGIVGRRSFYMAINDFCPGPDYEEEYYVFDFDNSLDQYVFERGEALHHKAVSKGGPYPYLSAFCSQLTVFFTMETDAIYNMWRENTVSKLLGKKLWYPDGVQPASCYRVDEFGQVWIHSRRVPIAIIQTEGNLK